MEKSPFLVGEGTKAKGSRDELLVVAVLVLNWHHTSAVRARLRSPLFSVRYGER